MATPSERDAFYESFWIMPEFPTPQIKGGVLAVPLATDDAALTPAMADMRLILKNRLKLIELSREDELVKVLKVSWQYTRSLQSEEFHPTSMVSCRWKSCFTSDPTDMSLLFELPMVLFTRAMLLLNQAKCVSRSRDPEQIPRATALCLEAAGIVEHIVELMNAHLIEGIESPSAMPELSLDVLQSLHGLCLALAQQLSLVNAVLHSDKSFSKSVLAKLHSSCHTAFQAFEAVLQRSGGSTASSDNAALTQHVKALLAFASFLSKLHKAQAFLLTAEVEYQSRHVGRAVAFLSVARKLFQERTSINGLGLTAPPPSNAERLSALLSTKRTALSDLLDSWTQENASTVMDAIPAEESVLTTVLPQACIMKPRQFDATRDSSSIDVETCVSHLPPRVATPSIEKSQQARSLADALARDRHDEVAERIQVIDEHSDEENDAESASENEVFLERVDPSERPLPSPSSSPSTSSAYDQPVLAAPLQPTRQSLINALSDALRSTHPDDAPSAVVIAPPTRRQSERAPSVTTAQIAAIAERASRRKKSAGIEYKTEASKAKAEIVGAQERFKAVALQEGLQPPRSDRTGAVGAAAAIQVIQPLDGSGQGLSDADERMRVQLAQGKPIFRLAKDTRWKKELMFLVNDELVFVRKKALMFSTQKKVSWSSVQAIQLEQGEIKDTHFLLIVAKKGDEMTPFEVTASPPGDNPALFQYLHRLFQEKRKKSVLPAVAATADDTSAAQTSAPPLQRQHTIH